MHFGSHGVLALRRADDARGDNIRIGVANLDHSILQVALVGGDLALHDDHRVRPRLLIQLKLVDVPILVAVIVGREIACLAVETDEEINLVVLCINGIADVNRLRPPLFGVKFGIEDILPTETIVTVGGKIERFAVGVEER